MSTVEYIELFWDCPECGQSHISAVFNLQGNRCPNCWYWRVDAVKLYEAPDSKIITDPDLINRKPFWVCKVCKAVNEDTGLSPQFLQCTNCDSYQVSAVGGITGNQVIDQQAPSSVTVGETVEFRNHSANNIEHNLIHPRSSNAFNRKKWLTMGLFSLVLVGAGFFGLSTGLSQLKAPPVLQVQVTDRQWTTEVDLQEKKTFTRQSWRDSMPDGASIVTSETRQRGTRQEQRGFRTVMVEEQYQSGSRTETYYESERYQSGSRTETYYESERYQSGSRTETYYESERYQSGTEQKCKTTSRGNGVGQRTCESVPVYSTRQVSRTRSVPVYSTRQIPRTRSVPVYSTRQIPRTRSVPVYSTRTVPRQEPIMVTIPVQDTWVTYRVSEWVPVQTRQQTGRDNAPHQTPIRLPQSPPQRVVATRTTCRLKGNFTSRRSWFASPEVKSGVWELPCQEYDRVNIGQQVKLRQTDSNFATLVNSSSR